ncbi:DUF7933 domain-containing protein [Deinococcus ruber]|uniref:DUF7933 domain-containing protein n=1 Tax=Deinococcus ruber TaxID=1848197 RepID=A0A918F7X1_9DEIO|nr:DUF11 domain-containing protein [Deinococcus ruber]GGR17354.1 hypothetical protein GCM10008957_32510 [Deinococcus ruber]
MLTRTVCLLLAWATTLCGVALADTPVSITVTPSSGKASSMTTFQATISNTVPTPLTNVHFSVPIPGAQTINVAGATSTCGGSFSVSGTTLSFNGGSLPGNATCTLSVPFQLPNTPGSNTIQFPAGTLGTDQGSSNGFGNSQTYVAVGITPPFAQYRNRYVPSVNNSYYPGTTGTLQTFQIDLKNTDTADLRDVVYVIPGGDHAGQAINTYNVPYSTTPQNLHVSCTDGTVGSATYTPVSGSDYGTFTLQTPLLAAGGTCTLAYDAAFAVLVDAADHIVQTKTVRGQPGYSTVYIGGANARMTSNSSDLSANYDTTNHTDYLYPSLVNPEMDKLMNTLKVADVSGSSMTMQLDIGNAVERDTRYTFSDAFPTWMTTLSNTTVSSSTGCDPSGFTFSGTTVNASVLVPASKDCRYNFVIPLPSTVPADQIGVYQNNVLSPVTVDVPQTVPAAPANAYWRVTADVSVAKYAIGEDFNAADPTQFDATIHAASSAAWDIRLTNNTNRVLTGATFTDTLPGGASYRLDSSDSIFLPAQSRSTCGGVLTASGTAVHFAGGTVPAGGTCDVYIAVLPPQYQGPYTVSVNDLSTLNTTPHVTLDNGTAALVNDYAHMTILVDREDVYYPPARQGQRITATASLTNNTATPAVATLTIPLLGLFTVDSSGSTTLTCNGVTTALPPTALTVTTTSVGAPVTIPADVPTSPDPTVTRSFSTNDCELSVPLVARNAGSFRFPNTLKSNHATDAGFITAYVQSAPTLSVSKTFTPSTINAGQTSSVRVSLSSGEQADTVSLRDTLPTGLIWVFTPNQPDGSFQNAAYTSCAAGNSNECDSSPGLRYEPDGRTVQVITGIHGNFTVDTVQLGTVVANTFGDLTNTIQPTDVSSINGVSVTSAASASLKVTPGVNVEKTFNPSSIPVTTTSTLTLTLKNLNPSADVLGVDDHLPAGVVPVQPFAVSGTCTGPTTYDSATNTLRVRGATLASGGTCTVRVVVTSGVVGSYTNTIPAGTVMAGNGTNPTDVTATLTVIPNFYGCLAADQVNLSGTILSPGTTSFTRTLTNTGVGTLTATGSSAPTWTATIPAGYSSTYQFGSALADPNPQLAWAAYAGAVGGLPEGTTVQLISTVQSLPGLPRGAQASLQLQAMPGTPNCGALTLHDTVTVIQAVPGTTKTQALCSINPDGSANCSPDTTNAMDVRPCDVVRYTIVSSNTGDANLRAPTLRDTFDAILTPLGIGAFTSSGTQILLSTDGGQSSQRYDPANPPSTLIAARSVQVGIDDGSGHPAPLSPNQTLTLVLYGQVPGTCQTNTLAPSTPWRSTAPVPPSS